MQSQRPNLHVIIVGSDCTAYGRARSDGLPWSEWAKSTLPLDSSRTHWLGSIQEAEYHKVLTISDVHFYLTIPFVLSWSLIEAMAVGCPIVASATPPVLEVLTDKVSALLVDFYDIDAQVSAINSLLSDKLYASSLSSAAQSASAHYDSSISLLEWDRLMCTDS